MLSALGYAAADRLVAALPEPWCDGAARAVARVAHAVRVPARSTLERNLTRLEPLVGARLAARTQETFEQFGLVVADFLRLGLLTRDELGRRVHVRGGEHLAAAEASPRGCIVLSVHSGCWEWGAAFLASRGRRMRLLARPHDDRAVEELFRRRRAAWGVQALEGSPLWLEAAHALRRGDWLAVMGDRAVPELRGSLCAWALAMARRTGAMLLPVGMTRLPGGEHALWCDAPLAERPGERSVRAALHRHLERSPGQWFAFAPLPEGLA